LCILVVGFEPYLYDLQSIADGFHGRSFCGDGFDAFHDEVAEHLGYIGIESGRIFGSIECCFVFIDEGFFLSAHCGGNVFAGEAPVHGCSEVVDIGSRGDFPAVYLFGCDVIDGSLNSFFDGAYGA